MRRCLTSRTQPPVTLTAAVLLGAFGCRQEAHYVAAPPPTVTVSQPVQRPITEYYEFTGTTEASESVNIRARVEGFLESVNFQAGSLVEEGDLLFVIDPKPFEARLKQAEAELASRRAELELAEFDHKRVERLHGENRAAEFELAQARASWAGAMAAVQAAEAAVDQARLNLGYTHVYAPIRGRVNRTLVDAGNLVGAGEYTLLTTILKDDPIFAYFSPSERELLEYLEAHPERRVPRPDQPRSPVHLGLASETGYPHVGSVDWSDNRVDADTGTIQVRGVFPNAEHVLVPGLFVRIRVPASTRDDALLITERALGADQGGRYLWIVNQQNAVEKTYVEVGPDVDGMRVIEQGLSPDAWVIVKGIQRAREGITVNPVRQAPPPENPDSSDGVSSG